MNDNVAYGLTHSKQDNTKLITTDVNVAYGYVLHDNVNKSKCQRNNPA